MASNKEYLEYILDQLSEMDDISYRAMSVSCAASRLVITSE